MKKILLLIVLAAAGCSKEPAPLTPLQEYNLALQTWNMERRFLEEIESNEATIPSEIANQKARVERAKQILIDADEKLKSRSAPVSR